MSCASIDPRRTLSESPSGSSGACRPEEEEDRLSTAAPSICEDDGKDATSRWADLLDDFSSHKRWADLLDSDEEDLKSVPASKAASRWADQTDEPEGTASTQSPDDTADSDAGKPAWTQRTEDTGDSEHAGWKLSWKPKHSAASTAHSSSGKHWRPREEKPRYEARGYGGSYSSGNYGSHSGYGHGSYGGSYGSHSYSWGGSSTWERPKSKGKGKGKAGKGAAKCQCQFIIGIEEEPKFRVCRRLLGPQGQHMKDIAQRTEAKLRLRGRGSKFVEGPEQQESTDPLMLCVSAPDTSYEEAKHLVSSLLEDVYAQYREFQQSEGSQPVDLFLNLHEGPRPGSF